MHWLTRRGFLQGTSGVLGVAGVSVGGFELLRWQSETAYDARLNTSREKKDETKLLTKIVRCATLTPNSHNTQPWQFEGANEVLNIKPDLSRW